MKKSFIVLFALLMSVTVFTREPEEEFLITKEGTIKCQKISLWVNKARIVLANGEKSFVPIEQISSFIEGGKQFDKLTLFNNGKTTNREVFMELLKSRDGLVLYKYVNYDYTDFDSNSGKSFSTFNTYYVYRADKLYLELTENSLPSVFQFFDVKYTIM